MGGVVMKTFELYQMISNLEPENKAQAKLFKKLIRVIESDTNTKPNDRTQVYIDSLSYEDVVNKEVGVVYNEYAEYCKKHYYTPLERSYFSKRLCDCIDVKSKVKRVNGEVTRIYY